MKKVIPCVLVLFILTWFHPHYVQGQEEGLESERAPQRKGTIPTRGLRDAAELETFLDGVMAAHMKSYHIAGATLSVVKDGEIFFAKGYGYADLENKKPVTPDKTLFRPGSVSKLFTWTAVMQLVEQGKLDLNADINIYLKDFKIPDTFPEPATLTHLLTHTPGFEDRSSGMGARSPEDLVPLGEYLANNKPARVLPPGKLTAYSNYGTALAGYIVEVVSGMPFEEYVEEKIYAPLDMQDSTFRQPVPPAIADNMSTGYSYEDGVFKEEEFELINGLGPAGSMSATAADMAKFMIAHLNNGNYGGNRILQEETARLMHSQLFTHDPRLNGNAHGFWERNLNSLQMIGHEGDTFLFHTLLTLNLEENIGLFVSYNSAGAGMRAREQLLRAFLNRYYPIPELPDLKPSPGFEERAKRFTGSYGITRAASTTYEKVTSLLMVASICTTDEETLLLKLPAGLGSMQWVEVGPLVFQELGGQETLIFREDDNGKITHAFLSQFPIAACVKLAWYETPVFHLSLFALSLIIFLSVLRWPIWNSFTSKNYSRVPITVCCTNNWSFDLHIFSLEE